ncbi:MAG: acetylglutamate kinase [Deltaproteobacteria bacterium]|nr:acetylglutamate kinase [Deltaproteobacteria bacterium]
MVGDLGPSLSEAAPYIQSFRDQFVVIKLGGELFDQGSTLERIVPQVATLYRCGLRPVLVHGGGKQIDERCAKEAVAIEKRHGRRITSPAVLEIVLEVVGGDINGRFCQLLEEAGVPTHGFAAGVAEAIHCRRRPPVEIEGEQVDFGEVGDVLEVHTETLVRDSDGGKVPVFPSIGMGENGPLNVNADSIASKIAVALRAQKLVMLSRVAGVMEDLNADGPISQLTTVEARELIDEGIVEGGMRAKLEEALSALTGAVAEVHVISGVQPQTLLREIFTDEGCGTWIRRA